MVLYFFDPAETLHLVIGDRGFEIGSSLFDVFHLLVVLFGFSCYRLVEDRIDRVETREEPASLSLFELVADRRKTRDIPIPV